MAGTIECILKTKKVKYHKIRIGSATPSPIYIPPNTITKKFLQQKQHYVVMNIKTSLKHPPFYIYFSQRNYVLVISLQRSSSNHCQRAPEKMVNNKHGWHVKLTSLLYILHQFLRLLGIYLEYSWKLHRINYPSDCVGYNVQVWGHLF